MPFYISSYLKKYFKDISNNSNFLRFIATDITQKQILILPEDLKKYNINNSATITEQ